MTIVWLYTALCRPMRWLDSLSKLSTTQLREPPYLRLQALKHITNSGQKKLDRILFLPETFIHVILSHLLNFASVVSFLSPCFPQILGMSLLVRTNFCSNCSGSRKEFILIPSLFFCLSQREREFVTTITLLSLQWPSVSELAHSPPQEIVQALVFDVIPIVRIVTMSHLWFHGHLSLRSWP